ncbi:hypothetical protein RJ55_04353 [Drechmeria coniospora]|nr:hypothetical protein RJ55_04353 [Drechmeria coniospora]
MARAALLAGLLTGIGAAQDAISSSTLGFHYMGCVAAAPSSFPLSPAGIPKRYTAAECFRACVAAGANYAALGNGCHCDNAAPGQAPPYESVAESECSQECIIGDWRAGRCGGPPASNPGSKQVFSLYMRTSLASISQRGLMTDEEDCDDDKKAKEKSKVVPVVIKAADVTKTITSCPPDVVNCPAAHKATCPPGGCRPAVTKTKTKTMTTTEPCTEMGTPPPVVTKIAVDVEKVKAECPGGCHDAKVAVVADCPGGCHDSKKAVVPTCPGAGCNSTKTDSGERHCAGGCKGTTVVPPPPATTAWKAPTDVVVVVSEGAFRRPARTAGLFGLSLMMALVVDLF